MNKDELKFGLSIDNVYDIVAELGGEPISHGNYFVAKTICHHGDSHKLYYYDNTHLFQCYSGCEEGSFDIFQLVMKVRQMELFPSILYVAQYFGYTFEDEEEAVPQDTKIDWDYFRGRDDKEVVPPFESQLKEYDGSILHNFPTVRFKNWENEGISFEVLKKRNICYDPANQGIVIPHYDINGRLVGIRERTLIKDEEDMGKYRPAMINGKMYNHPLGFCLYNLNNSKDNIKRQGVAIVGEGEKFCLSMASFFGEENDISVACCGSNVIAAQIKLLISCGAREVIIAFDRQFQKIGDDEYKQWTKKLEKINEKYRSLVRISFMFDKYDLLKYKESPTDEGAEVFRKLFERRIYL